MEISLKLNQRKKNKKASHYLEHKTQYLETKYFQSV